MLLASQFIFMDGTTLKTATVVKFRPESFESKVNIFKYIIYHSLLYPILKENLKWKCSWLCNLPSVNYNAKDQANFMLFE